MICTVGLNCLDIVSFTKKYPEEDTDQRCTKQTWERGGNASNNATVLACLNQPVEFFGTLSKSNFLSFFTEDFAKYGIKFENCPQIDGDVKAPISVVLCSEETGSRTIVHSGGTLRDLTLEDFKTKLQLDSYSWIHFEGRNEVVTEEMMKFVLDYNNVHVQIKKPAATIIQDAAINLNTHTASYFRTKLPISVEVEKTRKSLVNLIPLADVVFVGKDFARLEGAKDCISAVKILIGNVKPNAVLICPWGDQGAAYCLKKEATADDNQNIHKVDAYPPSKLVDSLGAGDTFLASVIYCLNRGFDIDKSVRLGCRMAGEKLAVCGFSGIKDIAQEIVEFKE